MFFWFSSNNTFSENNVANNREGIQLHESSNNIISGNNITNNGESGGIWPEPGSSHNVIYHNNFINSWNAFSGGSPNTWDNGYPSGGNYWSDYSGADQKSGPYQNVTGSDGIGDTPYIIGSNNVDRYPLMNPYSSLALAVSVSPSSATLDIGQSKSFTSSASGGSLPYKYQWCLNGVAISGANNSIWTFTPPSVGSYTVHLNVTDAMGVTATSNNVTVKVNAGLSVSILPTNVTTDAGQSKTFTATVSGGTASYYYQWYLNGLAVGTNSSTWIFSSANLGTYSVYLNVTDSAGITAKSNVAQVTVYPPLSVTIVPLSASIYLGQSVQFSSTATGGSLPYTQRWYLDGTVVYGANSTDWSFTPTQKGTYYVWTHITDNSGTACNSAYAQVTVTEKPTQPSVGGVSRSVNTFCLSASWLSIISLLAGVVLLKVFIARKRRR
jgi:parallel beta-helix repeat protein